MSKETILIPKLSEKTYSLSEARVYAIVVPGHVNKHAVKSAIESQFDVKVSNVNILTSKGKTKMTMSITGKRYLNSYGKRSDFKKAYVSLAKGSSLPFFTGIEEEEEKEEKAQKNFEKAIEKQTKKESKPRRRLSIRRKQGDK